MQRDLAEIKELAADMRRNHRGPGMRPPVKSMGARKKPSGE
jgi:hypothetical protein